jgi:hypothetical protein
MGFPLASMNLQSMEALHWLEGMSLLQNRSTPWFERAQSRVFSKGKVVPVLS